MIDIFSTSYNTPEIEEFITSFVKLINPKIVVEIGTQQGKSAVLIGRGLKEDATIHTFDKFEDLYEAPPYSNTHANLEKAQANINSFNLKCKVLINKLDGISAIGMFDEIDLLHIDICNHYDNIKPIVESAYKKVNKAIILEGGINNNWQRKIGLNNYKPMLDEEWLSKTWDNLTVKLNEHNAITIMTKK